MIAPESTPREKQKITGSREQSFSQRIRSSLSREQFAPSILGLFVNPFYFARKGLYRNVRDIGHHVQGKTLDVGCGQKPYRELFRSSEYIGLEIDTPETRQNSRADVFYEGRTFPFADSEFDSAVVNQAFEHVFHPEQFLREIRRVLHPGGILLMTVPFVWDEHEQPRDFARYTSFALQELLHREGFAVIEARKSIGDIRLVFQLLIAYIYKVTLSKNKYLNLFLTVFLMAPFNIVGELLAKVTPKNEDLYLDNVILARKNDQPRSTN
jgi:SAM-dependent methyltransferase